MLHSFFPTQSTKQSTEHTLQLVSTSFYCFYLSISLGVNSHTFAEEILVFAFKALPHLEPPRDITEHMVQTPYFLISKIQNSDPKGFR
jgi:hypothetical protein